MTDEIHDELPPDVVAALRAPTAVDDATRDAQIERALVHFDSLRRADDPPDGVAPVLPLRPARRTARWVAVAAAVVVAAGGVWLARGGSPSGVQTAADSATRSTPSGANGQKLQPTFQSPAAPARSKSTNGASSGQTVNTEPGSLSPSSAPAAGPASVADQLARPQTESGFSPAVMPTTTVTDPASRCRAPRRRAALISITTTTIKGNLRLVYTYASGPDGEIVTTVILDPSTCAQR